MCLKLLSSLTAFLFLAGATSAQEESPKPTAENRFSLSFGPQYNFNKGGVQNAPNGPKTVSASNTVGGYIGLGYERKTRKGLVFSYDLQLRTQPQEVFVQYDLEQLDPRGSQSLGRLGTFSRSWNKPLYMLDNRLMVGYEHPIGNSKNGLFLQEKGGLTLSQILGGTRANSGEVYDVTYVDNVTVESYKYRFMGIVDNVDNGTESQAPPHKYFISGYSLNLYLGLVKKLNKGFLKSVSFGVEGRWSGISAPIDVYVETTSFLNGGAGIQSDRYQSTYRSLGLHIALNFWK